MIYESSEEIRFSSEFFVMNFENKRRIRPHNGILPMVTEAMHCGIKSVIWKMYEIIIKDLLFTIKVGNYVIIT